VSTCNDISRVGAALARQGFAVFEDHMRRWGQTGWDGGRGGRVILVTNMKVSGHVIDDRCLNWRYGQPTADLWLGLDFMRKDERARREVSA
jgi:hypothetical protein